MTATQSPTRKPQNPVTNSVREHLLSGEWFALANVRDKFSTSKSMPGFQLRWLQGQGHRFERRGSTIHTEYRHTATRCTKAAGHELSTSTDLVPVNQPSINLKRRGRVSAAVSLAPPLDSSVTINMIRREHDGGLTLGLIGGEHEYVVRLIGAMPVGVSV